MPNATKDTKRTSARKAAAAPSDDATKGAVKSADSKTDKSTTTRRRRPAIKQGGETAAKSAQVTQKLTGTGAEAKTAAPKQAATPKKGSKAKTPAPVVVGKKPVRGEDGAIESFPGFGRFQTLSGQTDRNRNRIAMRFERPINVGTMIHSPLVDDAQRAKIEGAYASVRGLAPFDDSEQPVWPVLGMNDAGTHTFWLVGTTGDDHRTGKLIVVRENKTGDVTLQRWTADQFNKQTGLLIEFNEDSLSYWHPEPVNS